MARFIRSSQAAALRPRGTGLGAERWRGIGAGKFVGNGGRGGVTAVYIGASWAPRHRRLRLIMRLSPTLLLIFTEILPADGARDPVVQELQSDS
jgi:hypothetical protein